MPPPDPLNVPEAEVQDTPSESNDTDAQPIGVEKEEPHKWEQAICSEEEEESEEKPRPLPELTETELQSDRITFGTNFKSQPGAQDPFFAKPIEPPPPENKPNSDPSPEDSYPEPQDPALDLAEASIMQEAAKIPDGTTAVSKDTVVHLQTHV